MTETAAGRLARTYPDLGGRELKALLCENQHREHDGYAPAAWRIAERRDRAERAVVVRAEDAAGLAGAKALPMRVTAGQGRSAGLYGLVWSPAYWACLP